MPGLQVCIIYDSSVDNMFLIAKSLANTMPSLGKESTKYSYTIKCLDSREPPKTCDICIHLGQPYAVWFPWSKISCIFLEEWTNSWNGYINNFDICVYNNVEVDFSCKIPMPWSDLVNNVITSNIKSSICDLLTNCVSIYEEQHPSNIQMPPVLLQDDCVPISIITLVYNRPKFIENACLNLLSTDYPSDKIEWVVVDDSQADLSPSNRVIHFQEQFGGSVVYIPLTKKTSIGEKRNLAIERAKHNIILMMDDDDHYPITSFRRRVAYLLKGMRRYECAVCTSIAMYDLNTGVSAVNVPPYDLSLGQRCSEATLTFTRDFWKMKGFGSVDMAEGEGFLEGREGGVAEMPPQQIIVALSHGTNTSRRKSPEGKPGCFWGFPRELLEFLHGLVGVKVEAV